MSPKVRAVFVKELRESLRDRKTIFATVLIPLLLYPVMLLGTAEISQMAKAKLDRETFEIAVPPGSSEFFESLAAKAREENSTLSCDAAEAEQPLPAAPVSVTGKSLKPKAPPLHFKEMSPEQAQRELAEGGVKAAIEMSGDFSLHVERFEPARIEVKFDQAEARSRDACCRVKVMLDSYRSRVMKQRVESKQLNQEFLKPFEYKEKNVAQAAKVGGSVLGSFLPLLFIMMIITGAMHPAIDMTAGEKERSTLETLIGAPVRPIEVIAGKFLAVATLALSNAALNVGSFAATFFLLPAPQMSNFQFPWAALPLTMLLLIPLTLFFAGLLLAVSSFASNQKEAQIYCLPVYLVPVLGMMVVMMPGIELEGPLLLAPVVNTALLIKELFLYHGTTEQVVFVFCSTCFYAAGMVALAARVFAREEVLFSAQGSLRLFLNRRFFKPSVEPRPGDSLLLIALLFPINFYFQLCLSKVLYDSNGFDPFSFSLLVVLPQFLLFLGLPILAAWYLKTDLKATFQWRLPSWRGALGAVCLGSTSWILAQQMVAWLSRFWHYVPGDMEILDKSIEKMGATGAGTALLIFLIGITPALCEEHLFRGFLQQGIKCGSKWRAIVIVGVVFGAYHFPLIRQPVTMLMGMTLAYTAFETRSIWPGVIYHCLHNSLAMVGPNILNAMSKFLGMRMSFTPQEHPPLGQLPDVSPNLLLPALIVFCAGLLLVRSREPKLAQVSTVQSSTPAGHLQGFGTAAGNSPLPGDV